MLNNLIKKTMSNEKYHSHKSISCSGIKTIIHDSLYNFLHPDPNKEPSQAMIIGSATHSFLLEKEKFLSEFYIMPKIDRRSKEGKEQFAWHNKRAEGKMIINDAEYQILQQMEHNRDKIDLAKKYCKGEIEKSFFGNYNGIDIRIRPDIINLKEGWIGDIKTTRNIKPSKFKYECKNLNYHLQAHFYSYMLGMDPKSFRIIAIENVHPYKIDVFSFSDEMLEEGEMLWRTALAQYKNFLDTGEIIGHEWHEISEDGSKTL